MTTATSDHPPFHSDQDYRRLRATRPSECSCLASSKPPKTITAAARMQPQSKCRLFLLPPELREMIYGYVFFAKESTLRNHGMTVSEAQSAKPASDLLCTCQIIFKEARDIFEVARTEFWTNTLFYIHLKPSQALRRLPQSAFRGLTNYRSPASDSVNRLHDRELQRIQKVIITATTERSRGGWDVTTLWLSSCCRYVNCVHKDDWIFSYGTARDRPQYLSHYAILSPGKWEKRGALVDMLGCLGRFHRVE